MLEPTIAKLRQLRLFAPSALCVTDKDDPRRANDLKDIIEPRSVKSNTETADPTFDIARIEIPEPKCNESTMDIWLLHLTTDLSERLEPRCTKFRIEVAEEEPT
jgi:hypothetical protein